MTQKSILSDYIPLAFVVIFMTIASFCMHQSPLRVLPLYISVIVLLLQTRVNRYTFLLGAGNSLLYGFVHVHYRLYASVIGDVLFSFPVQVVTFLLWQRHAYKNSTVLKKLSSKEKLLILMLFLICWGVMKWLLALMGSSYTFWDNTALLLGILATILAMMAYIEFSWINTIVYVAQFILNLQMCRDKPEMAPFLIFSVYGIYSAVLTVYRSKKLLDEQKNTLPQGKEKNTTCKNEIAG